MLYDPEFALLEGVVGRLVKTPLNLLRPQSFDKKWAVLTPTNLLFFKVCMLLRCCASGFMRDSLNPRTQARVCCPPSPRPPACRMRTRPRLAQNQSLIYTSVSRPAWSRKTQQQAYQRWRYVFIAALRQLHRSRHTGLRLLHAPHAAGEGCAALPVRHHAR